jgi:serine protease Do
MKRILSVLIIALLGGFSALMIERNFFNNKDVPIIRNFSTDERSSIPSSFAHFLANTPTTLPDFTIVAEMTVNTVVHIRAEFERPSDVYDEFLGPDMFRDFFFGPRQRRTPQRPAVGAGSGVIISHDGYVITNNHVVQDASLVEVTLNNNEIFEAQVIGTDPTTDLALLKIDAQDLPFAIFGDSDKVKVGEWVLAVGNPFNLTSTVTAGIVSAKGRQINILGGGTAIESFIQTDAAVNRGNSGGALVNTAGELVGINAAIASTTGTFAGYSFAIPSNIAKKVTMDLMEFGEVQRGFLGVEIQEVNPRLSRELELSVNRGVYVGAVADESAGKQAGLKEGDVITAIDGRLTNTTAELLETIGRKRPGDEVTVTYNRNGRTMEGRTVLKNVHGDTGIVKRSEGELSELLGARLENVNDQDLRRLSLRGGVRVSSLSSGRLAKAGVREGFVITHIDRQPVASVKELTEMLADKNGGVLVEGVYPNGTRAYYGVGL